MSLDRLTEKLRRASGVAQRATQKIEERADALLARESVIEKRTHEVFQSHESVLGVAESGLDEAEAALRLLSNDPLQDSPRSSEVANRLGRNGS